MVVPWSGGEKYSPGNVFTPNKDRVLWQFFGSLPLFPVIVLGYLCFVCRIISGKHILYQGNQKKEKKSGKMSERSPLTPGTVLVRRFSNELMANEDDAMSEKIASIPSSGSSNWLTTLGVGVPKQEEQSNHQTPTTPLAPPATLAVTSPSTGNVKEPLKRASSIAGSNCSYNPVPQTAPGASAAVGHDIENSIPLSIFPIAMDKVIPLLFSLSSAFIHCPLSHSIPSFVRY